MSRSGVRCPLCQAIMTMQDLRLDGRAGRLGAVMTAVVVDGPRGKEYRLPTELDLQTAHVDEADIEALYVTCRSACPTSLRRRPAWGRRARSRSTATVSTRGAASSRTASSWPSARSSRRCAAFPRRWPAAGGVAGGDRGESGADHQPRGRPREYAGDLDQRPEKVRSTFARFALPMVWDFVEACPLTDTSGGFIQAVEWTAEVCEHLLAAANGAPAPAVLRRSAAEPQTADDAQRPPAAVATRTPERTAEPPPEPAVLRRSAAEPQADDTQSLLAAVAARTPERTAETPSAACAGQRGSGDDPARAPHAAAGPQAAADAQTAAQDPGFDLICTTRPTTTPFPTPT